MSFEILKKIVNGALRPLGYVVVNAQRYNSMMRGLEKKDIELARRAASVEALKKELTEKDHKLGTLTKRLGHSQKELEALRLKLQQAIRADLERQFQELNKRESS